jgi:hypothetical protein
MGGTMSDATASGLLIEMRAEAFDAARMRGDRCANCGRVLAADEPVWLELRPVPGELRAALRVPLGRACASPAVLSRTEEQEAERCVGCGRRAHYGYSTGAVRRRQVLCSMRCVNRAARAESPGRESAP